MYPLTAARVDLHCLLFLTFFINSIGVCGVAEPSQNSLSVLQLIKLKDFLRAPQRLVRLFHSSDNLGK